MQRATNIIGWKFDHKAQTILFEHLILQSTLSKVEVPEVNFSSKLTQLSGPFKVVHITQFSPGS